MGSHLTHASCYKAVLGEMVVGTSVDLKGVVVREGVVIPDLKGVIFDGEA